MIQLANALGSTLTLPVTIGWRRVPLGISVPTVANAQGVGSVVVGASRLEARQFTLSGSIYHTNKAQIVADCDELLQFLQHPPIEVFRDTSERRMYSWPQGAPQDWMDAGAELVINVPMIAPDPLWYGSEVVDPEAGLISGGAWQLDVAGTAPTHPKVQIEVGTAGSGIEIENTGTGLVVGVSGSYQVGDVVTIDTAAFTATLLRDGVTAGIVDLLADDFIADGFSLSPGTNTLSITGAVGTVTLTYRPRWY